MRCIKEDGSSLYKLTDFGGARELEDNDVFMSLHGTEEYLHPNMYEKAFVADGRTRDTFTAEVDLWSLGATFYHCIAGETPFRPFNGRQDKATMIEMTKNKESGVISGVQRERNGPISYSKTLPKRSPLTDALKALMESLLGHLLERNVTEFGFTEYFNQVDRITSCHKLELLDLESCMLHQLYVQTDSTMPQLKEIVEQHTGITQKKQIFFTDKRIGFSEIQKTFLKFNRLYVTSTDSKISTDYPATVSDSKFSKNTDDVLSYNYSLSYAICVEAYSYLRQLDKCVLHCNAINGAIQAITDFCQNNPARLKVEISGLHDKSRNLEIRRSDIIDSNCTFIRIIDLLISVFNSIDPKQSQDKSQFDQHVNINSISFLHNLCETAGVDKMNNFAVLYDSIGPWKLLDALYQMDDDVTGEFLKALPKKSPILYLISTLKSSKQNLISWAEQKKLSGSNVEEQLDALLSKIVEIEFTNSEDLDDMGKIVESLSVSNKSMRNVLQKMTEIQEEFEEYKKNRIKVTSTIKWTHQLKRNYLYTLKSRAKALVMEAIGMCKKANTYLQPKLQRFLVLEVMLFFTKNN